MPKWANALAGGWDVGALWIWESGSPFTVSSGFATGPSTANTWANYTGSRNIGSVITSNNGIGPGVYYFTPAQIANFSEPVAGDIGNSGRNAFRGPRFFNVDASLVKRFEFMERKYLTFRAEAYNLVNNVNFANPGVNLGGTAISFRRDQQRSEQPPHRATGAPPGFLTGTAQRKTWPPQPFPGGGGRCMLVPAKTA